MQAGSKKEEKMDLDAIGLKFQTDKASDRHDYLRYYERFIGDLREKEVKVLEVGVFNGASLRAWEEYFASGQIIGVDIRQDAIKHRSKRISIELADQSDIDDLIAIARKHGPFDLIVEDGSHIWNHQITTLKALYPYLKTNGIYIAEDLQTNYCEPDSFYRGNGGISCVEYLKKAIDYRVAEHRLDVSKETDDFLRSYAATMNLTFTRGGCIIEKTPRPSRHQSHKVSDGRLLDFDRELIGAIMLSAHFGGAGDMFGRHGSLQMSDPNLNLQGFSIDSAHAIAKFLRYRARNEDGSWTGWVGVNDFVGTQAQGKDLHGFSVSLLHEHEASGYKLKLVGGFRGHDDLVVVDGSGDCLPPKMTGALYAIQISLVSN